jgi:hypothetical protein
MKDIKLNRLQKLGQDLINNKDISYNSFAYRIEYNDLYNQYKDNQEFIQLNKYVMENLHYKEIKSFPYLDKQKSKL